MLNRWCIQLFDRKSVIAILVSVPALVEIDMYIRVQTGQDL